MKYERPVIRHGDDNVDLDMVIRGVSVDRLIFALVWAAAIAGSSGSSAEIYKWVDQNGVTNYSGAAPATGKAQTLDVQAASVSVYPAPAPQDAARALEGMMRRRIAGLENELRAQRLSAQTQQISYSGDSDRLAYEQCVKERRVDCDAPRDGRHASPYFYAAAPVLVVGRPLTTAPLTAFRPIHAPGQDRPAYTAGGRVDPARPPQGLSRKFR